MAESLVLDDISTGASNNIERATKIAREMVTTYGMSDEIGTLTYGSDSDSVFLGRDMGHTKNYSEEVASEIDRAMQKIVHEAYEKAHDLLKENLDILLKVSDALLDKETISGKEFEAIFAGESVEKDDYSSGEHLEKDDLSEEVVEELEKKEDK